jgi:CheY-like chemotaxis protein
MKYMLLEQAPCLEVFYIHVCGGELAMSYDRGSLQNRYLIPHGRTGRMTNRAAWKQDLQTDSAEAVFDRVGVKPGHLGSKLSETAGRDISFAQRSRDNAALRGCKVLVVEDEFLLATSTRQALCEAGAEVLGPVAVEDQALSLIATVTPSCALLDVNLGKGARFGIADALRDLKVPFMFVTSYDDVMIPKRFNDIGRIRKPSGFHLVVRAAMQMYHSAL